jgi:hypothetical protein
MILAAVELEVIVPPLIVQAKVAPPGSTTEAVFPVEFAHTDELAVIV